MIDAIEEILINEKQISETCREIGKKISNDYKNGNQPPLVIGLLKGCFYFMADLSRNISIPIQLDFISVSSYEGVVSSNDIKIKKDLDISVRNRDVLIVEDIIDTGKTLYTVMKLLQHRGAKSVEVATLLDKPEGRIIPLKPKYVGFSIPNRFVVGYGLDYDEEYRNLPFIGALKRKIYEGGE